MFQIGAGQNRSVDTSNSLQEATSLSVFFVSPSVMGREAAQMCLRGQFDCTLLADVSEDTLRVPHRTPDVVVVFSFLRKPEDLADLLRNARAIFPHVPLVALGPFSTREEVLEAMTIGAAGCVSAEGGFVHLSEAIATVQHQTYVCPSSSALLREAPHPVVASRVPRDSPRLTPRQSQILKMIADGCTDREIATTYRLSVRTVNTHRANIMGKLRVRNVTQLVRRASSLGLLTEP